MHLALVCRRCLKLLNKVGHLVQNIQSCLLWQSFDLVGIGGQQSANIVGPQVTGTTRATPNAYQNRARVAFLIGIRCGAFAAKEKSTSGAKLTALS
jgi:hypothetical protein